LSGRATVRKIWHAIVALSECRGMAAASTWTVGSFEAQVSGRSRVPNVRKCDMKPACGRGGLRGPSSAKAYEEPRATIVDDRVLCTMKMNSRVLGAISLSRRQTFHRYHAYR
jgi:hypothetical protein